MGRVHVARREFVRPTQGHPVAILPTVCARLIGTRFTETDPAPWVTYAVPATAVVSVHAPVTIAATPVSRAATSGAFPAAAIVASRTPTVAGMSVWQRVRSAVALSVARLVLT